jgi:hypothetical protein
MSSASRSTIGQASSKKCAASPRFIRTPPTPVGIVDRSTGTGLLEVEVSAVEGDLAPSRQLRISTAAASLLEKPTSGFPASAAGIARSRWERNQGHKGLWSLATATSMALDRTSQIVAPRRRPLPPHRRYGHTCGHIRKKMSAMRSIGVREFSRPGHHDDGGG